MKLVLNYCGGPAPFPSPVIPEKTSLFLVILPD